MPLKAVCLTYRGMDKTPQRYLAALLLCAGSAQGAGGHHAVDDAIVLDPGQCELETWWEREDKSTRTLLHAGPACRVGAVELGLILNRTRQDGDGTTTDAGVQVKWVHNIGDAWHAGVVLGLTGQNRSPHYAGSLFYDGDGRWVKSLIEQQGEIVEYALATS